MTRHIVFDLDGTLLDTEPLYSESAERVCQRFGSSYPIELKREIMGADAHVASRLVVAKLKLPISPEEYLALREAELERLLPTAKPMPGAREWIEQLDREGASWAIATSGHRSITELKLKHQPFLNGRAALVCGDDSRLARGKPAPDIFLLAALDLAVEPARCAVIEDSLLGARAGIDADMRTVVVLDPRFGLSRDQFPSGVEFAGSLFEAATLLRAD